MIRFVCNYKMSTVYIQRCQRRTRRSHILSCILSREYFFGRQIQCTKMIILHRRVSDRTFQRRREKKKGIFTSEPADRRCYYDDAGGPKPAQSVVSIDKDVIIRPDDFGAAIFPAAPERFIAHRRRRSLYNKRRAPVVHAHNVTPVRTTSHS